MNKRISRRSLWLGALVTSMSASPQIASATIVTFHTVVGRFEVNLYDNATPETVANFMNYVNNGLYTNTIFHRTVSGFVVQGGGFTYAGTPGSVDNIATFPAVINEPVFSNLTGTIAMAKLNNASNSATSQWFFNMADNNVGSNSLDIQNGGFTVFGEVIGNGMDVLKDIAVLPRFDFGDALTNLPLQNYSQMDFDNRVLIDDTHLALITEIEVTDSNVDSADGLNPVRNTSNTTPSVPPPTSGGGGGGGSFSFFALLGLLLTYKLRKA